MAIKTFSDGVSLPASDINSYLANSGMTYITSTTVSGASSASINNCFSSTYDNYRILIAGWNGSTTNYPQGRMRVGGVDKTASDYYYAMLGLYADNTSNASNGSAATYFENGMYTNSAGAAITVGTMDVFAPFKTERTFFLTNATLYAGKFGFRNGMVEVNDTTSYDGFSILASSGTFSAVITVYGYRKP
jgi:hypothetical protein